MSDLFISTYKNSLQTVINEQEKIKKQFLLTESEKNEIDGNSSTDTTKPYIMVRLSSTDEKVNFVDLKSDDKFDVVLINGDTRVGPFYKRDFNYSLTNGIKRLIKCETTPNSIPREKGSGRKNGEINSTRMFFTQGSEIEHFWTEIEDKTLLGPMICIYDPDNNKYIGTVEKSTAHGFGTLFTKYGKSFGKMDSGKLNGKGTVTSTNLTRGTWPHTYKGEFKDNKYHGYGIINYTMIPSADRISLELLHTRRSIPFVQDKIPFIYTYKVDPKSNKILKFPFLKLEGYWDNGVFGKKPSDYPTCQNKNEIQEKEYSKIIYENNDIYIGNTIEKIKHGNGFYTSFSKNHECIIHANWKNDIITGRADVFFTNHAFCQINYDDAGKIVPPLLYSNDPNIVYVFEKFDENFSEGICSIKECGKLLMEIKWDKPFSESQINPDEKKVSIRFSEEKSFVGQASTVYPLNGSGTFFHDDIKQKYIGNIVNNMRSGLGHTIYSKGYILQSTWKNDQIDTSLPQKLVFEGNCFEGNIETVFPLNGKGIMKYFDGSEYIGEIVNDKKEGNALFKVNDMTIKCFWKDDVMTSDEVTIDFSNKDKFQGSVQSLSPFCGNGTMTYKNKKIFKGQILNGLKEGIGTLIYPDGFELSGVWSNNKTSDNSQLITPGGDKIIGKITSVNPITAEGVVHYTSNKSIYYGAIINNKREGFGKIKYRDDTIIECEWKNNVNYGNCKVYFANGNEFEGIVEDFNPDNGITGEGILIYINEASFYEGRIVNNMRNGLGKLTLGNMYSISCIWEDNVNTDNVRIEYDSQNYFEGIIVSNTPLMGTGLLYVNGMEYNGEMFEMFAHGKGELKYNGMIISGFWEYGNPIHASSVSLRSKNFFSGTIHSLFPLVGSGVLFNTSYSESEQNLSNIGNTTIIQFPKIIEGM